MNQKDKERLNELLLKIWGKVAKNHRTEFDPDFDKVKDPFVLLESDIEGHKGRINKALRLLEGYIQEEGKVKTYYSEERTFRILRFEESKSLGTEPEMITDLNVINKDISYNEGSSDKVIKSGFKSELSWLEEIYIYWHKNEYLIVNESIYKKALLNDHFKRVMRLLVERTLKKDFPGYVQMIAPKVMALSFEETSITMEKPILFQEFDMETLEKKLTAYKDALELTEHRLKDINEILNIVEARGGFTEVIKEIRKQIIADFLNGYERFPQGFSDKNRTPLPPNKRDTYKNPGDAARSKRSNYIFRIFDTHRNLVSYENLYCDPNIGCEQTEDISIIKGYSWYTKEISTFSEEFVEDEKEDTRAA